MELKDFTACTADTGYPCLCEAHRDQAPEWTVIGGERVQAVRLDVGRAGFQWVWRPLVES